MKFVSLLSITALTSSILIATPQAKAAVVFLDLNSFTTGGPGVGTFAGTLGGVNVTGSILAGGGPNFTIAGKLPAHLNCLLRRGKRQEARGNSKGIGGDSANLKNKCFKCVLAY